MVWPDESLDGVPGPQTGEAAYSPLIMDLLRERLIDALEAQGRAPEEMQDGWVRYRCLEHEDPKPHAYLGEYGFSCFSCETKGSFKTLADRLKLGVSTIEWHVSTHTQRPKLAARDEQRRADREKRKEQVGLIWPDFRLTEQGRWYLNEYRGLDTQFAEAYGVRSFNSGCWPAAYLKPPGTIHRRGGLVIPYFFDPGELPVSFRVRAALPDEYTKCPERIKRAAKMVGKKPSAFWQEPSRYWAPKGHTGLLFNEVELRRTDSIDALWVAEGEIDALTLLQHGCRAVGLPGKGSAWSRLRYYLERRRDVGAVYLVPDDELDTIELFRLKVTELSLVSNATFHIMRPISGDLDTSLRDLVE